MGETLDSWAREQIGKIWGAHRELASDYWGPDRRNGRRSEVVESRERLGALETRLQHYLDAEREQTCHGLKALATAGKQSEELRKARLTFMASLGVGVLSLASAVSVALISKSPAPAYADIDRRLGVIEAAIMRSTRSYPDPSTLKPLEEGQDD